MLHGFLLLRNGDLSTIFASPPALQVLGSPAASVLNRQIFDLIHPEERELARDDLVQFMKAKTLYGSVTRCRMYSEARTDYIALDLYTNVVTDNLVFASLFRPIDRLDLPGCKPNTTGSEAITELRRALNQLLVDMPLNGPPESGPLGFGSRVFSVYDSDQMSCKLIYPPGNFRRLAGVESKDVESHVLMQHVQENNELALFMNDIRSVQAMDLNTTKRFCTIHYFNRVNGRLRSITSSETLDPVVIETVIDIQQDVAILISELRNEVPKSFVRGSSSDPRRMVPINTKIGVPAVKIPFQAPPPVFENNHVQNNFLGGHHTLSAHHQHSQTPHASNTYSQGAHSHQLHAAAILHHHSVPRQLEPAPALAPSSVPALTPAPAPAPAPAVIPTPPQQTSPPQSKQGAKACEMCGKTHSPEWRKGPSGEKTLCNACGLRYSRSQKRKKPDDAPDE